MNHDEQIAFNRKIAELAGWTFDFLENSGATNWWRITAPEGNAVPLRVTAYSKKNEWPDYDIEDAIPDYVNDLNAAISLFPNGTYLHIYLDNFGGIEEIVVEDFSTDKKYPSRDQLALALCETWLAWKEAQSK